jgi:putative transposase
MIDESSWTRPRSKDLVIEIVRRIDSAPGFVARTFGLMTRWRRLVRNYEKRIDVSKATIHVALGSLLLRRISL